MEVVRDTKDTSFNFGTGAMVGTFASLIVGGFMVGAGLNIFAGEGTGGGEGGTPVEGPAGNVIVGSGTQFLSGKSITAPPNTAITLEFDNRNGTHNVQVFGGSSYSGPLLTGCTAGCDGDTVETPIKSGPAVEEFTFTTPAPGEYAFNCVVHPDQMRGTLIIEEGASIPGAPAAAEGEPGAEASATAAP
jgi:plastocyanin